MFDLFHSLAAHVWSIFLVALFFGGSIFVHELGHFLAARRRGVHVERFSIGFGPPIFSWKGKDGVEYRIAWIPIGGYVLLPQLADLTPIEGEGANPAEQLPPVSYGSKMLVFVAGAAFNVLFAFALACIIWVVGQPQPEELATTRIGYISPTLTLADGSKIPSPAREAGLRIGDRVIAIDGHKVSDWMDLMQTLVTSSGRGADGSRRAVFTIERDGRQVDVTLHPRLAGEDGNRRVGIAAGYALIVHDVTPGSAWAQAGLQKADQVLELNGSPELNAEALSDDLSAAGDKPAKIAVLRSGERISLTLAPSPDRAAGIEFSPQLRFTHPSPFAQIQDQMTTTFRTLWSVLNPRSDIGLSKLSGPVGIVRILHAEAEAGIMPVLMFTILVNVNLAIFNLLPIPVLDGGHMLFATVGRLRGRALPMNLIANAQSVFFVLLISMILYVTVFDIRRMNRDNQADAAASVQPAVQASPAKP